MSFRHEVPGRGWQEHDLIEVPVAVGLGHASSGILGCILPYIIVDYSDGLLAEEDIQAVIAFAAASAEEDLPPVSRPRAS